MKLIYCRWCGDIKSPDRTGKWTTCGCGNASARWIDKQAGTLEVKAGSRIGREYVRVLGVDNRFLQFDSDSNTEWREYQSYLASSSDGYIFSKTMRSCPVAVIRPGFTRDIFWAEEAGEPAKVRT